MLPNVLTAADHPWINPAARDCNIQSAPMPLEQRKWIVMALRRATPVGV